MTAPPSTDQLAAAWRFFEQHYGAIRGAARRLAMADDRIEADELLDNAALWIARLHRGYDPSRAAPSTWAYWIVRRARQDMLERMNRHRDRERLVAWFPASDGGEPEPFDPGDDGSGAASVERLVSIDAALSLAGDEARACAQAVLDGLDGAECVDWLGGELATRRHDVLARAGTTTRRRSANSTRN